MSIGTERGIWIISLPVALLFLAVLGAEFENFGGSTSLLLYYVIMVSIIPAIVAFTDLFPPKLLPSTILLVSLSLVLHQALISQHLTAPDMTTEYYYFQETVIHHSWNPNIQPLDPPSTPYAATTSVTIFPAILGFVSGINGVWIFKAVFPALYSLVPFALYMVFERQFGSKPSFLAAFFFAAIPRFYEGDLAMGKQMFSTLLIAMFLLALYRGPRTHRVSVPLLFGVSAITAHYSTGLYLVVVLILATPFLLLKRRRYELPLTLSPLLVMFYFLWYSFITGGVVIGMFAGFANAVYSAIPLFFNAGSRYSIALISNAYLIPVDQIIKYLNIAFQVLIAIGVLQFLLSRFRKKQSPILGSFAVFAAVSFSFLALTLVLPYFGSYFDVTRLYTLSLLFLAPFGVLGCVFLGNSAAQALHFQNKESAPLKVLSLFAIAFLLFNIGFVSAITGEPYPSAYSLIPKTPYPIYNDGEYQGGFWLISYAVPNTTAFMDPGSSSLFRSLGYLNNLSIPWPLTNTTNISQPGSVFFIRTWNLQTNMIQLATTLASSNEIIIYDANLSQQYGFYIAHSNRVYDNGYSNTLYFP